MTTRVTNSYDAWGNKVQRQAWDGSTTTTDRYAVDGWDAAKDWAIGVENFDTWADLTGSNAITLRRGFGPGFDELSWRQTSGGTAGWYLTDRLGSVRGVTNSTGTPLTTLTYSGWGAVLSNSTPAQSDAYQFTGRPVDPATGLRNHRERDTPGNQWLQEDPLGLNPDVNPRRYVGNSPTNYADPSGLQQPPVSFNKTPPSKIDLNYCTSGRPTNTGPSIDMMSILNKLPPPSNPLKPGRDLRQNWAGWMAMINRLPPPVLQPPPDQQGQRPSMPVVSEGGKQTPPERPFDSGSEKTANRGPAYDGLKHPPETPQQRADRERKEAAGLEALLFTAELLTGSAVERMLRTAALARVAPATAPAGLRPSNFGLSTIAEDPGLHRMWTDAMRSAASSRRPNGYTRYLEALEQGRTPTPQMLEEAFGAVNKRFVESARAAGHDIAEVHHWNFNKATFADQIVDPRHLVPVPSRAVHEQIHRATTSDPTNIWRGPTAPPHVIPVPGGSTPLPPRVPPP